MKKNYKGMNIVIIGLGITGLSCIDFFLSKGVVPKVMDTRLYPPGIKKIPSFIKYCFGKLYDSWILHANLVVVSPGVRLNYPIFIEAMKMGIEIIGDIELFVREINGPIVAITGSNGKSTVTQLVNNMAKYAQWNVGVAGNIGIPALTLLHKQYKLYILELSSFQLDVTYSLRAEAATILNISEDHIDRYPGGLSEYNYSKRKIYNNAITCIVNDSDILTRPLFCKYDNIVSVSIYSDSADYRLECYKGSTWIVVYNELLCNCSELNINNYINYFNILSALALADCVKIPRYASLKALKYFSGLPHRLQLVYKNRNIRWINDSKSTNLASTKEAVNTVSKKLSGNLHLLLGGDRKSANFFELIFLIKAFEVCLYCFGKDGLYLTQYGARDVFLTNNMLDAMYIISSRVKRTDVVLLSPACSSLDQFSSFKSRGHLFTYFARKLG